MGGFTYQPLSDFALHHMGSTLADGVTQGIAGPDEFRTAPLWGVVNGSFSARRPHYGLA